MNDSDTKRSVIEQGKSLRVALLVIATPVVALLAIAGVQSRVPVGDLTRDPAAIAGLPLYTGVVSHVGVLLWCSAASVSLFASAVLHRQQRNAPLAKFLFCAGGFTVVLMIDDLFMVHEAAAYVVGIPDSAIVLAYGVLGATLAVAFRRQILASEYLLLFASLLFLGASIAVDASNLTDSQGLRTSISARYHLLEDGPKLLGIAFWLGYYARLAWRAVENPGVASHAEENPLRWRTGSSAEKAPSSTSTASTAGPLTHLST